MCVCVWHQASSAQLQSHGYGSPNSSLSAQLSLQLLKICHVSESPERHCRCRTWCWGVPRGAPQPTGRQGLFFHLCVTLQGVAQPQSLHPFVSCDSEPVYYFTLVLSVIKFPWFSLSWRQLSYCWCWGKSCSSLRFSSCDPRGHQLQQEVKMVTAGSGTLNCLL